MNSSQPCHDTKRNHIFQLKTKNIMKYFFTIIMTLFFNNCKEKEVNLENTNTKNLEFIDVKIDKNCNFYLLYFREGSIIGKINTSGNCKILTKENYYKAYEKLIKNNINRIPLKKGKLIFEFESKSIDSIYIGKLIDLTKIYFKSKCGITSIKERELTLVIK